MKSMAKPCHNRYSNLLFFRRKRLNTGEKSCGRPYREPAPALAALIVLIIAMLVVRPA